MFLERRAAVFSSLGLDFCADGLCGSDGLWSCERSEGVIERELLPQPVELGELDLSF